MIEHTRTFYDETVPDILQALRTRRSGLGVSEASERLQRHGLNTVLTRRFVPWYVRLLHQLKNPLAYVLLIAGVVTLLLGKTLDAVVIAGALFINVLIGFFQEGRAENVFETLAQKIEHEAIVLRDGKKRSIPAYEIVPGDVLVFNAGSAVVADARIIESKNLTANESSLTGEWADVAKQEAVLSLGTSQALQTNMLFAGTHITQGSGTAVVVRTGMDTAFGRVVASVETTRELTPLEKEIAFVARIVVVSMVGALGVLFVLGLLRGEPLGELLLVAIAIAVAGMPEGLPAAVSVTLALGMERLLHKGGLVKNLLATETLGSTTVIVTDKTGTLTEGNMELKGLYTWWGIQTHTALIEGENRELLHMAVRASDAFVHTEASGKVSIEGRPVERAIVQALFDTEGHATETYQETRIDFLPFDSVRRFAVSLNTEGARRRLYITGAPEHVLALSNTVHASDGAQPLTPHVREQFIRTQSELSSRGMRFTAVAYKDTIEDTIGESYKGTGGAGTYVFAGLLSFADRVRIDVPASVAEVMGAGVRVIMATGDNPDTARAIAEEVGIRTNTETLTGADIEHMSDAQLTEALRDRSIIARVLPEQKKRIVALLQQEGHVVAMTGDGVNDAPALVSADIGIALGSGTDAAKSASDLILVHNSFAVIVRAIHEGRRIMDNIRRIMAYLLSTSFSEVLLFGGALFIGGPLPALPAHILWANMISEGFMSVPLAFEGADKNVMKRRPEPRGARTLLSKHIQLFIGAVSLIHAIALFGLYLFLWQSGMPEAELRTVIFIALSVGTILFAFSFKNLYAPIWRVELLSNPWLIGALGINVGLLALVLFTPMLAALLSLAPVTTYSMMLLACLGFVNLCCVEVAKKVVFGGVRV